jgi:hypothetical protein
MNWKDPLFLVANIHPALSLLGVFVCLNGIRSKQPYIRLLGLIQMTNFLAHVTSILVWQVFDGNQNYVYSITNIVEFILIAIIYHRTTNNSHKNLFTFAALCFVSFAITNLIFIQQGEINSYSLALMSLITMLFALYYFYWLIKELPTSQLQRLPMFWINSAWMIFFSGNLFLFIFTDYLVNVMKDTQLVMWNVHNILKIIEVLMIVIALWIDHQNIRSRSSLA